MTHGELPVYSEDRGTFCYGIPPGREDETAANRMGTQAVDYGVDPPCYRDQEGIANVELSARGRDLSGPSRRRVGECCMGYGFPEGLGNEAPEWWWG